ncbi:Staphylococcal virulence regulator protein A [uncultured Clostridium sp.]|uniref:Probable multidrug resistance protein NorM n=1 Tax=Muricoprocola aceti TaxID=2981772 RepID=A0ABT2SJ70_9FIRM|nr:MATE family efflux transporter [Muricoprocola aceti]MCU6724555.1 MATE family efflux transporter [Muricoprocola aceti]SCH18049.1 Staphylococcal virulence regulator protein A [uncultured Clostridium sp.]
MEKNMATGSSGKNILYFALPVFAGNLFQQIYNVVDTVIVGKFVSTEALAAVGSTGTINFMILGFMTGLMAGITVLTSQRFGAEDMRGMRRSVASAGMIAIAATIILTAISLLGMHRLLVLMNTPDDIFDDAYQYIMIICAGILVQALYNLFACILRALGNSKVPLYFLLFSASMNIILDLVSIIVLKMGVAGAAYATVISQGVSAVLCFIYMVKKVPILHLTREDFHVEGRLIKNQLAVGLPMAFQYSITAIGTTMVQMALNTLGSTYVAAFTAASKCEQMAGQAYIALGSAMATFAAQNVGAGRYDRVRKGFARATMFGVIFSVVIGLVMYFFGYIVTGLFVTGDATQIEGMVDTYMKYTALFLIPLTVVNVYRNGIQGMGYGLLPMTAGIAELVGRGSVALIAIHYHSYAGVCLASPMAWILASALLLTMYFAIMKKHPMPKKNY